MIQIDFWLSIGSTYTYLSVMRSAAVAEQYGVQLRFRPFNVRDIMIEMNNIPFRDKPVKAAYMWRDLERRAARHGLPYKGPPSYPLKDLPLANRVAVVAMEQGYCEAYVRAAYRQWFLLGEEAGSEANLVASLHEAGADPVAVLAAANSEAGHAALNRETAAARALGIFGAPTFAVGNEIFWGDDRLEDAIQFASNAPHAAAPVSP